MDMTPQPTIDDFVGTLLRDKGLLNLDDVTLRELGNDLKQRVESRINLALVEHLPPSQLEEFERRLNAGDSDADMQAFIRAHIPNLEQVIGAALLEFRETYLRG